MIRLKQRQKRLQILEKGRFTDIDFIVTKEIVPYFALCSISDPVNKKCIF